VHQVLADGPHRLRSGRVRVEGAQHVRDVGPGHHGDRRGLVQAAAVQPPVGGFGQFRPHRLRLAAQPVAEPVGAGVHGLGRGGRLPHHQLVGLGFVGVVSATGVYPQPVVARPGWGDPAQVRLDRLGSDHRGAADGRPPADLDDLLPAGRDVRRWPLQDPQQDPDVSVLDAGADHRTARDDRDQPVGAEVDLRDSRSLQ
jgi:hypothetical protein